MAKKAKKSDDSDKKKTSKSSTSKSSSKKSKSGSSKTRGKGSKDDSPAKDSPKDETPAEDPPKKESPKKSSSKSSVTSHETVYALRNHPNRKFSIQASLDKASKGGADGASVTGEIREGEGEPFTYVVRFEDEFTSTKANFDEEMYLLTAISLMQSQIESHKHRSTLLRVHRDSGLIHTEPLKALS